MSLPSYPTSTVMATPIQMIVMDTPTQQTVVQKEQSTAMYDEVLQQGGGIRASSTSLSSITVT